MSEQMGFADTFLSKLKEQSFLIILMIAVIYYQNAQFVERIEEHRRIEEKQQAYIDALIKEDRQTLMDRTKYLADQRDKYVEDLISKSKNVNK